MFDTVGSPADDFNPMSAFLILHGLEGSGPDHWQTWLAGRLRERGERVSYPHLPDPFDPHPADWDRALDEELSLLDAPVVLCHSLACLLWLRRAARPADEAARARASCWSRRRSARTSSPWPAFSTTARGRET